MYNVKTKMVVLEIPKCGSRSLIYATTQKYGKLAMKWQGHHALSEFITYFMPTLNKKVAPVFPITVVAVIRNPVDRLFSQINHCVANKANRTLNEAMEICWTQSDIVFASQSRFTSISSEHRDKVDLRLWDMDRISQAQKFITGKEYNYHRNQRKSTLVEEDAILEHELFDDIMATHFKPDFQLWLDAQRTDTEGRRRC